MKSLFVTLILLLTLGNVYAQTSIEETFNNYIREKNNTAAFETLRDNEVKGEQDISIVNTYINLIREYQKAFPQCSTEQFKITGDECMNKAVHHSFISVIFLPQAFDTRARIKFKKEDYFGAISDWNEAIGLINKSKEASLSAEYYYNKGIAQWNLHQYQNACLSMSKSGELGFEDAYTFIKDKCNKTRLQ